MGGFSDARVTENRYASVIEGMTMGVRVSSIASGKELAFLAEQRRTEMFVTVSMYRAKAGEEDAVIALHEDWQRNQQAKAQGYFSGELLRNIQAPREFVAIMRFENRACAQELANDPEQNAWYRRLVSLVENVPVLSEYTREWPS
jgi:antibiotic biosynthesis monooxygenase (ABM) superfamily enzyme